MADLQIAIRIATEDASSGPIGKIKASLGGLGEAVTAPTRALGGLVSGLGSLGLAAAGVGAAFDAVKGVGSVFGLGALNEMEQTRASFMAFTKDAGLTEKILADVRSEAAKTPFAFGEMAKATASLMPVAKSSGAALMDLVKEAEILAASNPLEGLEGASFSLREAMTGDFTSIIERFNLSRQTINKLKAEGVPNLEIVRRAMQEMGFDADLIAAKAETLDGRWSTFQDTLQTLQMRMGQPIFDALKEGLSALQPLLDENMATFEAWADAVAGGLTSAISAGRSAIMGLVEVVQILREAFEQGGITAVLRDLGANVSAALSDFGAMIVTAVEGWVESFTSWIGDVASGWGSGLADLATGLNSWLLDSLITIVEQLGTWAGAFLDWIGPLIPPFLRELGTYLSTLVGWIVGTALPTILLKLGEWGLALVSWVAPRIGPLLLELGQLLLDLGNWLLFTALPAIGTQLLKWGDAFTAWVIPMIPQLLLELGKLEVRLILWIGEQVAGIATALKEWGAAFVDWIAKDVLPILPTKLAAVYDAVTSWIATTATAYTEAAKAIGSGILTGIQNGISGALGGFWGWLQANFVDQIPAFIKNILGIQSPSRVLFDIGVNMVEGLRLGLASRLPSVEELITRTIGSAAAMGGHVDDWLKAAMAHTGVGADWLPGLRWIVSKESSGDPRAKNPTSTAAGLFQIIDSTWAGSRDKNLPNDIFNPIINAVAGIRYIADRYGHPNKAIEFWRANNYYGEGGWITEPVAGIGLASGRGYVFGERGEDELVVPRSRLAGASAGGTTVINFNGMTHEQAFAELDRRQRRERRLLEARRGR